MYTTTWSLLLGIGKSVSQWCMGLPDEKTAKYGNCLGGDRYGYSIQYQIPVSNGKDYHIEKVKYHILSNKIWNI